MLNRNSFLVGEKIEELVMCRLKMSCVVLGIAWLLLGVSAANGSFMNGSFELPSLGAGNHEVTTVPTSWNVGNISASLPLALDSNGFVPGGAPYPDGGTQAVSIVADQTTKDVELWQNTGIQMASGSIYTFDIYTLNADQATRHAHTTVQFDTANDSTSQGTPITGATTGSVAATTSWQKLEVQYTAVAIDTGKYLTVDFWNVLDPGSSPTFVTFDAASLDVVAPEPGTAAIAVTGLLACAWRRRK